MTSSVSISFPDGDMPWPKEEMFRDEHGRHHAHLKAESLVTYTCSQGHTWTRTIARPCWCGWSKYVAENTPSVRIFGEMSCWVGEDNFILMNGKSYKGHADVRLQTKTMPEIDEILLENESPFCSLMRGVL